MLYNRANLWFLPLFLTLLSGCNDGGEPVTAQIHQAEQNTEKKKPIPYFNSWGLTNGRIWDFTRPGIPHPARKKLNDDLQPGQRPYVVINGGVTGSTTSGGASRMDWHMKSPPDYLIVALGGNDGLRGIPPQESKQNLRKIISQAQAKKVPVMIAGMKLHLITDQSTSKILKACSRNWPKKWRFPCFLSCSKEWAEIQK